MFDQKLILKFLKKLEKNNHKRWFDENRAEYQTARNEWLKFTQYLLGEMGDVYPEFFEQDPRKCIFRINRDVRFSKNKQPYKNNFGAHLVPGGKKSGNAGFYVHIEPGNCFLAAGIFAPDSIPLRQLREHLAQDYKTFEKIMQHSNLADNFIEGLRAYKLKRPPRGFDKDHPAIELLKHKRFLVIHNFTEKEVLSKNFINEVPQKFKYLSEFVKYLNRAMAV